MTLIIKSRSGYKTLKKLMNMLPGDKLEAILKVLRLLEVNEKNKSYNHRLANLISMEYLQELCSDDSIDMSINESEN